MKKLNLILKLKVAMLTNKSDICWTWFCCKFRQLHFCQILFKLVFISHCCHESHRGELFLKHSVVCGNIKLFVDIRKRFSDNCTKLLN